MSQLPPGPPPPPGAQGPPWGPPGPGGYGGPPPPGATPPGYGGYGAPPPPGAPPGGYGGPPPSGGPSKGPLIAAVAVVAVLVLIAAAGVVFALTRDGGTADLTESEMERALLDEDDVDDGFTEDEESDDDDSTDLDEIDADAECMDLLMELEDQDNVVFDSSTDGDRPKAEVSFSDDEGIQLQQTITVDTDDALDATVQVTESCGEIEIDDGDTVGQIEYTLSDPIDVGDDSVALTVSFQAEEPVPFDLEFEGIVWVRDGILSSLLLSGSLDEDLESTPPDRSLLEDLAVEADEKLQQVIEEDG